MICFLFLFFENMASILSWLKINKTQQTKFKRMGKNYKTSNIYIYILRTNKREYLLFSFRSLIILRFIN